MVFQRSDLSAQRSFNERSEWSFSVAVLQRSGLAMSEANGLSAQRSFSAAVLQRSGLAGLAASYELFIYIFETFIK